MTGLLLSALQLARRAGLHESHVFLLVIAFWKSASPLRLHAQASHLLTHPPIHPPSHACTQARHARRQARSVHKRTQKKAVQSSVSLPPSHSLILSHSFSFFLILSHSFSFSLPLSLSCMSVSYPLKVQVTLCPPYPGTLHPCLLPACTKKGTPLEKQRLISCLPADPL